MSKNILPTFMIKVSLPESTKNHYTQKLYFLKSLKVCIPIIKFPIFQNFKRDQPHHKPGNYIVETLQNKRNVFVHLTKWCLQSNEAHKSLSINMKSKEKKDKSTNSQLK